MHGSLREAKDASAAASLIGDLLSGRLDSSHTMSIEQKINFFGSAKSAAEGRLCFSFW